MGATVTNRVDLIVSAREEASAKIQQIKQAALEAEQATLAGKIKSA